MAVAVRRDPGLQPGCVSTRPDGEERTMRRRQNGFGVALATSLLGVMAVATIAPAADDRRDPAGNEDLRQRVESLEKQVKANEESSWPHLGGHFGFVVPLVTVGDGEPQTEGDAFNIGFPMGITVKKNSP